MKRLVLTLVIMLIGCTKHEPRPSDVWQSADATIEARLIAARQLVPSNATRPEIKRILGEPTSGFREHGFVGGEGTYHAEWGVRYRFGADRIKIYHTPYQHNESNIVFTGKIRIDRSHSPDAITPDME